MENPNFFLLPRDIRLFIVNKILDFSTFRGIEIIYSNFYYYISFLLKLSDQYSKDESDKCIEFLLKMDFDLIKLENLRGIHY